MNRLIFVLLSAVIGAFLLTAFFVWNFGPSGRYAVGSVLIEPSVLSSFNYNDFDPKTYEKDRFVFDKIVLEYPEGVEIKKKTIPIEMYEKIYEMLKGEKSILNPGEGSLSAFRSGQLIRLILYVRTESPASWQKDSKVFQEVDFVFNGNDFRVELHENNSGTHWVYFQKQGVAAQLMKLLSS